MVCPVGEPQALFFWEEREGWHFLWFIHGKTTRSEIKAGLLSSDPMLGKLLSDVGPCSREITEKTGIMLAATKLWLAHLFILTAWTTQKSPADIIALFWILDGIERSVVAHPSVPASDRKVWNKSLSVCMWGGLVLADHSVGWSLKGPTSVLYDLVHDFRYCHY